MPAGPKSRFAHLPGIFARAALLLVPVILLASFVTVRTIRHTAAEKDKASHSSISANSPDSLDLSPVSLEPRPVFPYSIVPGGVRNAAELQAAAKADAVVAKHYADFGIAQARPKFIPPLLAMFVSYRRDNQVFWTKNRMVIPAGETLISDGENLARVRCGNRLSPIAVKPVAASEPTTEELNEPKFIPPLLAQMLPGDGGGFFPVPPANALPPDRCETGGCKRANHGRIERAQVYSAAPGPDASRRRRRILSRSARERLTAWTAWFECCASASLSSDTRSGCAAADSSVSSPSSCLDSGTGPSGTPGGRCGIHHVVRHIHSPRPPHLVVLAQSQIQRRRPSGD